MTGTRLYRCNTAINNIISGRSVIYLGSCTYYHTARLLSPHLPIYWALIHGAAAFPLDGIIRINESRFAFKFHFAVFMQLLPALHSASASLCTKKSAQHSGQGIAAIVQAPLPLILERRRMMHRETPVKCSLYRATRHHHQAAEGESETIRLFILPLLWPALHKNNVFPRQLQQFSTADDQPLQLRGKLHAFPGPDLLGTLVLSFSSFLSNIIAARSRSMSASYLLWRQGIAAILSSLLYFKQKYVSTPHIPYT
jgi:hypothetical protein